jgi:tRNA (guanine37-N1)-methyltransferase
MFYFSITFIVFVLNTAMLKSASSFLFSSARGKRPTRAFFLSTSVEVPDDWRQHPALNYIAEFPTWITPNEHCQTVLSARLLQPYLARIPELSQRIRVVRGYNESHQLILQSPQTTDLPNDVKEYLSSLSIDTNGPMFSYPLTHTNWTVARVLSEVLPKEALPPPTAFETIGHIVHFNLKGHHLAHKQVIGEVVLGTLPGIETVVNKVGEVGGDYRTYEMEVLAGRHDFNVSMQENKINVEFDLREVYWCSRLGGERQYMVNQEFKNGQTIADPFCGVGALCVLAAKEKKCKILANDWNPRAVSACNRNAQLNGVNFQQIACQDAYDFMTDLGLNGHLPHHVVMNYPGEAPKFLTALRWWPQPKRKTDVIPRIHVYTFAKAIDGGSYDEAAIDLVVDQLIPEGGAAEKTRGRKAEFDRLGCNVNSREIRDVAPGKVVVCVSFSATAMLLRHIQGDFV